MVEHFIKRPILSLVISIFIVLLGILSFFKLPVTQFPDIVPPSVTVTAKYTGANAEVCTKAVTTPLERAINGVPGMTYMNSVSNNDGITLIQVFFKVGTDPDMAAVNVQNRVTTVLDELPEEVIKAGVTTEKEVNSMLMYLNILSTDTAATEAFIYNFADINILPELKRIEGVGFAEIMGQKEYSMRVWLKPERLVNYNVSTEEIIAALRNQNIEAAPGKTGESSGKMGADLQYVIRYSGKFSDVSQYEQLPIRSYDNGNILRLKDVADIEFGSMAYTMVSKTNGRASASIMLKQRPGSNAQAVINSIKKRMQELQSTQFPNGMEYNIAYDVSRFLDASIHEVVKTLIEAFILVFIVVYLFLQNFRFTLIPALAVPVALIGTLAFMQIFGFSINLLTLFALVLAIGIVVDNAIVVVETVHVQMHDFGLPPVEATIAAMKEITGAIIAITLVMSAVFIPVAFLSGPVGIFYRQFSLTLAIAIVISGINALTLTPALCALILKPNQHSSTHSKGVVTSFFASFNHLYTRTESSYQSLILKIANRRLITFICLLGFCVATWGVAQLLPNGFIPNEDQGMVYVNVTTPPGATVERTEKVLSQVQQVVNQIPEVENITTLAGYSLLNEVAGASYGMGMINLKAWNNRKVTVPQLIKLLEQKTTGIQDAKIEFFSPPTVPGFGNASGFELRLLDKTGKSNLQQTAKTTAQFIQTLKQAPAVGSSFTNFNPSFPQYTLQIDYDIAAKKGITVDNLMSTLQTMLGSTYATNFIKFGQMYKVMVQAHPIYRSQPESILQLYVKNNQGEQVPVSTFTRLEKMYGPEQLTRYNMYTSALINGDAAPGYSSGDVIKTIQEAAKKLPKGYSYEFSGMTREEILSGNQAVYIFAICLIFVYLLLAAQYESFVLPLPVLLSLPTGIFGAFAGLYAVGLENNIYAQVALVMLIGLLGKNAIIIVEFAVKKQADGATTLSAITEAATSRLRPILMTSFAFIAGLIPLCIASGAGAIGNRSIGTAAASGMLIGTVAGVIFIPGLYMLFSKFLKNK